MFKASFQRQARLGNVARRHVSTLPLSASTMRPSSRIAARAAAAATACSAPASSPAVSKALAATSFAALRHYSSSSAAEMDQTVDYSEPVTNFADLERLGVHPNLIEGLTQGLGYETMTDVQSMTMNPALQGKDLVAQAKTGTGKTLAFLVPIFQRMIAADPELANKSALRLADSRDIRGIIMSPTRELAEQIGAEARKLAAFTGIKVQTAVGGTRKREALFKMQREGCHLLVATPGRLVDLMQDPSTNVAAPRCASFVLDEADRMLDVGFSDALRDIQSCLPSIRDVDRQTLLFSATIPRDVVHLAKSMVKVNNFEFIQTIREDEEPTHDRIPQHVAALGGYENWFPSIMEITDKAVRAHKSNPESPPFKAMIFFSNTVSVQMAYDTLRRTDMFGRSSSLSIFDIHSGLEQAARTRNANAFRRCESGVLISSDVTARGMDFPGVTHVIQVGLPPNREQYIHRLGRTGRAGKSGEGWLLLAQDEIPEARSRLPGLPIRPNNTLASARNDTANERTAEFNNQLAKAYTYVADRHWPSVYSVLITQKGGRNLRKSDVVKLCNDWSRNGFGWEQPPAIARSTAQQQGLLGMPGINIGEPQRSNGPSRNGRSSFGRSDSGGFGRSRNGFEDQFASKSRDSFSGRRGGPDFGRSGPRATF